MAPLFLFLLVMGHRSLLLIAHSPLKMDHLVYSRLNSQSYDYSPITARFHISNSLSTMNQRVSTKLTFLIFFLGWIRLLFDWADMPTYRVMRWIPRAIFQIGKIFRPSASFKKTFRASIATPKIALYTYYSILKVKYFFHLVLFF